MEKLQLAAGRYFGATPVFVYFDAVDIWGSEEREPDPVQKAAFDKAAVRILIRRYQPNSGPIEGWLSVDLTTHAEFEDNALARALAAGTGVSFYYLDPVPDPDDEPGAEAAQMEIRPDATSRNVWLSEFSDASGTRTIV